MNAADLLVEQCATVLRKYQWSDNECCPDCCAQRDDENPRHFDGCAIGTALAAIDSHIAQSAGMCPKCVSPWKCNGPHVGRKPASIGDPDYWKDHEPPHCPTCGCGMEEARTARGGVTEAVRALQQLAEQFDEMSDCAKREDNYERADVWRNAASQTRVRMRSAALSAAPVPDTSAVRAPHEGRKTT